MRSLACLVGMPSVLPAASPLHWKPGAMPALPALSGLPPPPWRTCRRLQPDAEHTHSSDVTSVGIKAEGQLDFPKVQEWLSTLLQVG